MQPWCAAEAQISCPNIHWTSPCDDFCMWILTFLFLTFYISPGNDSVILPCRNDCSRCFLNAVNQKTSSLKPRCICAQKQTIICAFNSMSSNASRSPVDLVKGIGQFRETEPFVDFWVVVWQDTGLFWVVAPLFIWAIVGVICAVALFYQRVLWVSRFAAVGTDDSAHNLQSLPSALNPNWLWCFALVASSMNVPYYYSLSILWANTDTAYGNLTVFILQICATTTASLFLLCAAFKSTVNLIECMNYRDSAHKPPEPPEIARSKKHPSIKEIEKNRSLWKENNNSSELASAAEISSPSAISRNSHVVHFHHNTATPRETVRV